MSKDKGLRNIDDELYRKARSDAVRQGYKNIGQWLNEAIAMKLALYGMKFYIDQQGYPTLEDTKGDKAVLREGRWLLERQA